MYNHNRFVILFTTAILFILLVSSPAAIAMPDLFPSGQVFDLTPVQRELLKQKPDIDIFPYRSQKVKNDFIEPRFPAKAYQAAGNEFLAGAQKNMTADLKIEDAMQKTKTNIENDSSNLTRIADKRSGIETEFILSMGYRVDNIDWNIAGNTHLGNYVNVLSELTWNNIEIYQLKLHNRTILRKVFYLRGSLGYGWIFDGDNQDSDYSGNNRTLEYSRSNNSTDDGNVWDASLGVGYRFTFGLNCLSITPLLGYSYHQQNLIITDGNQTIPSTGPFSGLDSTYIADWNGPWIGLDLNYKFKEKHTIFAELEYHWADYYAEANWNLRTDYAHPTSFEHDANGNGIVISTGCNISFNTHWSLNVNFDYQKWSTDTGLHKVFFINDPTIETPLNEVNWKSYAIMIGTAYHF